MAAPDITFAEVTPDRWGDLEELFEAPGGPKNCWCMVWRAKTGGIRRPDAPALKAMLRARVAAGEPVGLLAYAGGKPVGWCSVAPRPTFRDLGGPADHADDPGAVWSLTCFFVASEHRGESLGAGLLQAAIDTARHRGAAVLEAYPVDSSSPSYRVMGFVGVFQKAGFTKVGLTGLRRYVMRLAL